MLATHGRGPVRRFLLGSVTAKALHDLSAAVWTGSHLMKRPPRIPCKSVLCAVDDSEEAEAVLRASAEFACTYQAQLWLVHVVETPPPALEIDLSPYTREVLAAANFRLRELKAKIGLDVPHVVIDAAIADGVSQEAVRRNADLILTGRGRAQATFSRMWSRLYPIVREAPCPVLSI
jgi:nucleotide-binding universal stress UspA family protein